MNRLSKVVLIGLASLLLLAVAAVVGLNLYLQAPSTQARIQKQLSEALGMPIEITRCTVGWNGVAMSGLRVPQGQRPLMEATSFTADYRLLPLFARRLEVKRMVLENPRVLWAQNAEGKWVLPLLPRKEKPQKIELPTGATPTPTPAPGAPKQKGLELVLNTLEVRGGTLELVDSHDQRILTATGVEMQYTLGKGELRGSISAERLVYLDATVFTEVRAKLLLEDEELRLQDLQGSIAGGQVLGEFKVHTEKRNSPFEVRLNVTGVDLARLTVEHDWAANQAAGIMGGEFNYEASLKKPSKGEGKGFVTVSEARFAQLNLFQTIGTILQIPELSDLHVRTGRADFKVEGEKVELKPLVLDSGDINFTSTGTIKFDKRLDLQARLAAAPHVVQRLPSFVVDKFDAADPQGKRGIVFAVKGTTDKPKPDLVERVVGQRLGSQFTNLLSTVFGGSIGGEKKKETDEEKRVRKEKEKAERKAKKEAERMAKAEQEKAAPAPSAAETATDPHAAPSPAPQATPVLPESKPVTQP